MSNSSMVDYVKLSPNHSGYRTHSIDRISPHCVVGQCSVESLGREFSPVSKQASCNYGIGVDGKVLLCVEECNRSWCTSSNANDQRAVTIECASDSFHPYRMTEAVYNKLVLLCVDICKRNGKNKLLWLGDKYKTLSYDPKPDEMVLTVHRWFANKSCPGDWLYSRLGQLADTVTKKLNGSKENETIYRVQVGAFKSLENARKMEQKVRAKSFCTYVCMEHGLYKIQVGAFRHKSNAQRLLNRLSQAGFGGFITTK